MKELKLDIQACMVSEYQKIEDTESVWITTHVYEPKEFVDKFKDFLSKEQIIKLLNK